MPGTAIPSPYGGKERQIQIDLDPQALQSKGLSAEDVANALSAQNQIIPAGTAKIGQFEYDVKLNNSPSAVDELNNLPVKTVNGATIYMRDVAHVRDGAPPQSNEVRVDGQARRADERAQERHRPPRWRSSTASSRRCPGSRRRCPRR